VIDIYMARSVPGVVSKPCIRMAFVALIAPNIPLAPGVPNPLAVPAMSGAKATIARC